MTHEVHEVPALDLLDLLEPESVDLFLTDPPYDTQESQRNRGTNARLVEFFTIIPPDDWFWVFAKMTHALKPSGRILMTTDEKAMDQIKKHLHVGPQEKRNFRKTQLRLVYWDALVWNKVNRGMGYHGAKQHEFVMIFEKYPATHSYDRKIRSVLEHKSVRTKDKYPTEKPLDLAKELVQFASNEGDLVVDPFCGSGVFGEAAKAMGRDFVGGDISKKAVELARRRLS